MPYRDHHLVQQRLQPNKLTHHSMCTEGSNVNVDVGDVNVDVLCSDCGEDGPESSEEVGLGEVVGGVEGT